jgi:hypothetical protein
MLTSLLKVVADSIHRVGDVDELSRFFAFILVLGPA